MKSIFSFIVLALLLGCSSERITKEIEKDKSTAANNSVSIPAAIATSKIIFGGAVGKVNSLNRKISFAKDESAILKDFNSLLSKGKVNAKLTRLILEEVDGKYLLKGYGTNYKSSMLLLDDGTGSLQAAGITCTTSACASSNGCTAMENNTCSTCDGDCKKETTITRY